MSLLIRKVRFVGVPFFFFFFFFFFFVGLRRYNCRCRRRQPRPRPRPGQRSARTLVRRQGLVPTWDQSHIIRIGLQRGHVVPNRDTSAGRGPRPVRRERRATLTMRERERKKTQTSRIPKEWKGKERKGKTDTHKQTNKQQSLLPLSLLRAALDVSPPRSGRRAKRKETSLSPFLSMMCGRMGGNVNAEGHGLLCCSTA